MDNEEIEILCKNILETKDHFLGVFASDMIPERSSIEGKKFLIANLDPSYKDGSHWVCMIFQQRPDKDIYFDSYGRFPPKNLEKHLRKGFKHNTVQLQHPFSTACGQWCIFFSCAVFSDHSLKNVSDFFDMQSDLLVNDYVVNKFINSILPNDNIHKVIDRSFVKKQFAKTMKDVQ